MAQPFGRQYVSYSHGRRRGSKQANSPEILLPAAPVLTKPRKFSTQSPRSPSREEHNRIYKLSFDSSQEQYIYKQLLRCLVFPDGTPSTDIVAITNKELLERLRQAFGVEKDIHDKVVLDTKAEKGESHNFVESDQCTVEEFYTVVNSLYRYSVRATAENPKVKENGKPEFHQLPNQLTQVINQFAGMNNFTSVTRGLVESVVVMELGSDKYSPCAISEKLLRDTIISLELDWQHVQLDSPVMKNVEMSMFDKAASAYVTYLMTSMRTQDCLLKLFPCGDIQLDELSKRVGLVATLLKMDVWRNSEPSKREATDLAIGHIQEDVKNWVIEQLIPLETMEDMETVVNQASSVIPIINEATEILTHRPDISAYFSRLGVDYFKLVSLELDKRLSSKVIEQMQEVDRYQVKNQKHHDHTLESSNVTLTLYNALQAFSEAVQSHVGNSDVPTLISCYQSWFEHAVMFWLQIFRGECIKRMERALEIEKDIVQVTSLVKHSNSYVDVVSCFTKTTVEWNSISFSDADIAVLGCTKITDTICDGATQYVEKLHINMQKNGYFDFIDNAQFDVTDQLCITLNNVMHIRKYLDKLPSLLNYEEVCQRMTTKYENPSIGEQSAKVLENLIAGADYEMMLRCRNMIHNIVEKIAVDLYIRVKKFTQKAPEKKSSIDDLFGYLDENLKVIDEKLEKSVFPLLVEDIFYNLIEIFYETTLEGKPTEYYRYLHGHLDSIRGYVQQDIDSQTIDFCDSYNDLIHYLENHEKTAQQLALMYYKDLHEDMQDVSSSDLGYLNVSVACKEEKGGETVTIFGRVYSAKNLPGVTKKDALDSFVTISIHPHLNLPESAKPKQSKVIEDSQFPLYDENFEFNNISRELCQNEGAVIIFTIWHHETVIPDDFIGEVVVPLRGLQTIDRILRPKATALPITTLPLSRPSKLDSGPFVILQQRQKKDKDAKKIVETRELMAGWKNPTPAFSPLIKVIAKAKGKKDKML